MLSLSGTELKTLVAAADTLKDVYLSMWADADIGDATDDVYGCDTIRQGAYFYGNQPDAVVWKPGPIIYDGFVDRSIIHTFREKLS